MKAHPLAALRGAYFRRRHTNLLVAIVLALGIRPLIGEGEIGALLFSVALLLMLMVALLTIQVDELIGEREVLLAQRRRRSIIVWVLAVPSIAERIYVIASPSVWMLRAGTITWLLFLGFVTWSLLRSLLKHKEVTGETISLSIAIYLLFGMVWGLLYVVIYQFQPEAFRMGDALPQFTAETEPQVLTVLFYFSLTTLSTIGFGDITPGTLLSRYAAVAEGITGQFYLAILVARLVGMHMSHSQTEAPTQRT